MRARDTDRPIAPLACCVPKVSSGRPEGGALVSGVASSPFPNRFSRPFSFARRSCFRSFCRLLISACPRSSISASSSSSIPRALAMAGPAGPARAAAGMLCNGARAREADLDIEPETPADWMVCEALTGFTGCETGNAVAVLYLAALGGRCAELPPLAICACCPPGEPNGNAV